MAEEEATATTGLDALMAVMKAIVRGGGFQPALAADEDVVRRQLPSGGFHPNHLTKPSARRPRPSHNNSSCGSGFFPSLTH